MNCSAFNAFEQGSDGSLFMGFINTMTGNTNDTGFTLYPPLDGADFSAIYNGDLSYARDIFSIFLKQINADFQSFKIAFASNNLAETARLAHKMKSSFGMACLPEMVQLLIQLELSIKNPTDTGSVSQLFESILKLFPVGIEAVEQTLNSLQKT